MAFVQVSLHLHNVFQKVIYMYMCVYIYIYIYCISTGQTLPAACTYAVGKCSMCGACAGQFTPSQCVPKSDLYVYIYVCVCVCVCVYIYIYIYIYIL